MLVEEIKKSCTRRGLRPVGLSEETILSNSPYIDWLVELDALRVKDGLLARYSEELSQHHRSMKEVASIKSSISSSLDSYYAIRSIGFGADRNANESAEHEMMLDELLAEVHEKLELINGSLATYYDIENQTWNSIFAVIFAIFAFGSIATTFVFAYLPSAGFLVSVAIVAAATATSVCIVLVIVRTLTRRRASRR